MKGSSHSSLDITADKCPTGHSRAIDLFVTRDDVGQRPRIFRLCFATHMSLKTRGTEQKNREKFLPLGHMYKYSCSRYVGWGGDQGDLFPFCAELFPF